ncbi:hypothetical protein LIER_19035 [Lithospermum erythrorhizon]|uniref:Uncharacterized protein n=1 Tax=Lithospermum erythrorhizon TaxID=34254 RepID=A0AAV3QIV5_LITER
MAGIGGLQYLFPTDFYYPKPSRSTTISGEAKTSGQEQIVVVQRHQELEEVNGNDGSQHNRYAMSHGKIIAISASSSSSKSLEPVLRRKQYLFGKQDLERMFLVHERFRTLEK